MQKEYILQSDLLDILFDQRNKNYGAYPLRKHYSERLYKSLGLTFLFAAALVLFTFIPKRKQEAEAVYEVKETGLVNIREDMPKPKDPPKPKAAVAPAQKAALFTSNVEIVQNPQTATKITNFNDSTAIGVPDKPTPGDPGPSAPIPTVQAAVVPAVVIDPYKPLQTAEVMPSYPGGLAALRKFLERNLENPQEVADGETVSVKVKFVVGYDGVLQGFETIENGGEAFNNEVIRVLKKMPAWIPGKTRGQAVSVYYVIPVKFTAAQ